MRARYTSQKAVPGVKTERAGSDIVAMWVCACAAQAGAWPGGCRSEPEGLAVRTPGC